MYFDGIRPDYTHACQELLHVNTCICAIACVQLVNRLVVSGCMHMVCKRLCFIFICQLFYNSGIKEKYILQREATIKSLFVPVTLHNDIHFKCRVPSFRKILFHIVLLLLEHLGALYSYRKSWLKTVCFNYYSHLINMLPAVQSLGLEGFFFLLWPFSVTCYLSLGFKVSSVPCT